MKKTVTITVGSIIIIVIAFFALNNYIYEEKQAPAGEDPRNTEYSINNQRVALVDGYTEMEAAPGSASKIITRYFGNELTIDLNEDGREDTVALITQETGGSGTFFYVVAALNTERGYIGSHGLLIGDRIAPQTINKSQNPSHKNVIVVNYADRKPGEPMTTSPSLGKSIWLKLDPESMQFGEVVQNFEGEADPSRMNLFMKTWIWEKTLLNNSTAIIPKQSGKFTVTFKSDGTFSATTDCNGLGGNYTVAKNTIAFSDMISTLMYCDGSQETEFQQFLRDAAGYHFTSKGELVLDLKFDSGSVIFK